MQFGTVINYNHACNHNIEWVLLLRTVDFVNNNP